MEKIIKTLLLTLILMLSFTGCEEPGKEEIIHSVLTVEKEDVLVLNKTELKVEFLDKKVGWDSDYYEEGGTYVVFRLWVDIYVGIRHKLQLKCGAESYVSYYLRLGNLENNSGLEEGSLSVFSKQDLDEHNCLQADGQLENLTGSLYGYAEYTQSRTTPVKHTVTSNSITYAAQEINEAFALFNE